MNEASFASLSPTLLARKGGAKPAMRPQLAPIPDASAANLEDLGWNDMGGDEHANVVQLTPPSNDEVSVIKLASIRWTPTSESFSAIRILSSFVNMIPACCSPSRRVMS